MMRIMADRANRRPLLKSKQATQEKTTNRKKLQAEKQKTVDSLPQTFQLLSAEAHVSISSNSSESSTDSFFSCGRPECLSQKPALHTTHEIQFYSAKNEEQHSNRGWMPPVRTVVQVHELCVQKANLSLPQTLTICGAIILLYENLPPQNTAPTFQGQVL